MARPNRYSWSEKKIEAFLREGRGSGSGRDYRPWLNVTDVPSRGVSSQPHFDRAGRRLQLLSDLESAAFLRFWWDINVIDLREQFPLPRDDTRDIAASLGVLHPRYPRTSVDAVMTTDFLITRAQKDGQQLFAFAVKTAEDASNQRSKEKLEIECRFWQQAGVAWRIITDAELGAVETINLSWLFGADLSLAKDQSPTREALHDIECAFAIRPCATAATACLGVDKKRSWEAGRSLAILRAGISARLVWVDPTLALIPQSKCDAFDFDNASS